MRTSESSNNNDHQNSENRSCERMGKTSFLFSSTTMGMIPCRRSAMAALLVLSYCVWTTDATRSILGKCAGTNAARCGYLGLGFAMRAETGGTCKEICSYLPKYADSSFTCGYCVTPPTIAPTVTRAPTPATFQITLDFANIPVEDQPYFRRARTTWTDIIKGDLPEVNTVGLIDPGDGCIYPDIIDDIYVCCRYLDIDGAGAVVGRTLILFIRDGQGADGLTFAAEVRFDTADIASLKSAGNFQDVIEHELAHALGFGSLWKSKGLIQDNGNNSCTYTGTRAKAEYKAISGCSRVPNTCGHWNETCLGRELMTTTLDTTNALSKVTIGSMEDLGYKVDYTTADPYTVADINVNCLFLCPARNLVEGGQAQESHPVDNIRRHSRRLTLSLAGYNNAVNYGRSVLKQAAQLEGVPMPGMKYIGADSVYVLYMEDKVVYSVFVQ
jgi:hypothetical protein